MRPQAKALSVALRILLGATFLYSAFAKAYDFGPFELRLIELPGINIQNAAWLGVILLLVEYYIGFSFLSLYSKTKWLSRFTAVFLLILSGYLLHLLITKGNNINCGCMGEQLPFTPLQALVKNLLLGLCLLLLQRIPSSMSSNRPIALQAALLGLSTAAAIISPHDLFPKPIQLHREPEAFKSHLLLEASYHPPLEPAFFDDQPKIIAFLSMRCSHCLDAASRLAQFEALSSDILLVLNGDTAELASFKAATQTDKIKHTMLDAIPFIELAGNSVPVIYLTHQQNIQAKIRPAQLRTKHLQNALEQLQ